MPACQRPIIYFRKRNKQEKGRKTSSPAEIKTHSNMCMHTKLTYLAGLSFPLREAHALESILQVNASSTMRTWTGSTVIQIWGKYSGKWLTDQKPDFHGWKSLSSYKNKNKNVCRKEIKTLTSTGWIIPALRTLAFKPCWNLAACTTICTRTGNTGVLSWRSNSVEERETLISYEICLGIFFLFLKVYC